ncbi:hypothetical protein ASE17_03090 [Phenylobacterium sp. Root77]|jgi:hypothetical protein|uniref:hypothetical protein n=1 Tax=unclassified Phenylobacterium TaxID=2640670 RepID=UPI0006F34941|nr:MULTISPECIES: hypothetical protein [unclassified Phenylobacterium]KQW71882.1 hypothetical protein ASC73_07315 [Phenylobacterium sp. Root1277]KQW94802.1 hypothetical protein ASC79_03460 [Phenylobacterium sp. Root1290]KRC44495.1 hypothetical protein ASE17_03090 [Phenylobacterium sp. Root77]
MLLRFALVAGLSVVALAACSKRTMPPGGEGICWSVSKTADGELKFNKLKEGVPDLEHCAAELEGMRVRFLRMGGSVREVTGAYKGNFIFVERRGIFTAPSLEQAPYLALVRTGDGRLAVPGAMPREQAPAPGQ